MLTAAMAAAKVEPDDPSSAVLTGERDLQARLAAAAAGANPVIGTEPMPWTRYLLVAVIACLIEVVATLAIGFVVNRRRRISMAHA